MPKRLIVGLGTLALLAGCGSSPKTHFFELGAVPGPARQPARITSLQVTAVHVPASLDRLELVTKSGGNQVAIHGQDRWTAPLGEIARATLARDLAERLPPGTVVLPHAPTGDSTAALIVTLLDFGPQADGTARLVGSWAIENGTTGKVLLRRDMALDTPSAGGPEAAPAAMSLLLGKLADQIAEAVSTG